MVGYDLDGTICERCGIDKSFFKCTGTERKVFRKIREYHIKTAEVIRRPTESQYYIITSRPLKSRLITLQWLQEKGFNPFAVYFMTLARKRENMIIYKSKMIKTLEVNKYYEDDPKIAKGIAKNCPNTEVITVEPVIKNYSIKEFSNNSLQI